MKYFNTFKRGNGSYVTQEWTADEMFNFEFIKCCVIAIFFSFISVIVSAICLFVRLWDYEEDEKGPSYVGIISAGYFLIDYWRGWIVTWIIRLFEDAATIKIMVILNATMLISHLILLIFGDTIYFNTNERTRYTTLIYYMVITVFCSYYLINSLYGIN